MQRLVVGNLNYSSWSMRAWLALRRTGVEFEIHDIGLYGAEGWKERILGFSGAGTVPVLVDGALSVHESLAICEYVAERQRSAGLWPADLALRARARAISCEMLAGFGALRSAMPCNLRARAKPRSQSPEVRRDVVRVLDIWESSLAASSGPFLFGEFSIADCMYFPVAARFRTYGVSLPEASARYSATLFAQPEARELERIAAEQPAIPDFDESLG